ncbi:MarR family transcriptional regulator [Lentilitoribacter sp. Alg239-R112]|uniref:MarR family winged helix-turn-helix transcriptional regulator n=1 Tax=Lentilitoribacter sp. Alg239-R112 TaxID=2305987 RepID=UPI0013A69EBF|nr:MarR family transcriptional regulator [Lentilitoribacter sp. Alg239-R112]
MKLETYFPYKLAATAEAFSRKLVEVYGHTYGLSREEWRLLLLLAEAGQLSSLELKQRTTLDKVQVSRAAQKLEDKGYISRSVPALDRRLRVYTCTETGQNLFSDVFPKVQTRADAILENMSTDDRNALNKGIEALAKAVLAHAQNSLKPDSVDKPDDYSD